MRVCGGFCKAALCICILCFWLVPSKVELHVFELEQRGPLGSWPLDVHPIRSVVVDDELGICAVLIVDKQFRTLLAGSRLESCWWNTVLDLWLFKALVALLDTPLFYLGTALTERWLGVDPDSAARQTS